MRSPARILYRLLKSGAEVKVDDGNLKIRQAVQMTDEQRQAVSDHKTVLLDLVDWYEDDAEIIRTLAEDQFVVLAEQHQVLHGAAGGGLFFERVPLARNTVGETEQHPFRQFLRPIGIHQQR